MKLKRENIQQWFSLEEAVKFIFEDDDASVKNLIEFICQSLTLYANDQTQNIEAIAGSLKELAGAAEFLGSTIQQDALLQTAQFVQQQLEQNQPFNTDQIHCIFNVLAGIDMLVDNLKNKQPVLQSMFNVALSSSQQLQKKAA